MDAEITRDCRIPAAWHRQWHPRNHRLALGLALAFALPTCFALTASYTDETAFIDWDHVIRGILPYLGANGPFTGFLLFVAVVALEYCGFALLGRQRQLKVRQTRERLDRQKQPGQPEQLKRSGQLEQPVLRRGFGWSLALGLILALTLTIPAHNTSHLAGQLDAAYAPPSVASMYWTGWYWAYYALRYVGFAALMIAISALMLHGVLRAIRRAETAQIDSGRSSAGTGSNVDVDSNSNDVPTPGNSCSSTINDAPALDDSGSNDPDCHIRNNGTAPAPADSQKHVTGHVTSNPTVSMTASLAATLSNLLIWLFERLSPARTFTAGGLILLAWTPWMAMLWPANIAADTVAQLVWMRTGQAWDPSTHQTLTGYALSDQHPWLDSLIYGAFDQLGLWMGSEAWGLWMLAATQTVLCALALGLVINYLAGVLRLPRGFCTVALAFMAFVPMYGRLMMSVVKDSTVMPVFLVLMVLVVEYVRRVRGGLKLGPWLVIGIVMLAVLCGQMRKISVEIIAGTFVVLALVLASRHLTSLALAAAPLAIGMIISAIAMPALHIAPGGKQEMIAIPLQQTSAIILDHGSSISEGDQAVIDRIITCPTGELSAYLTWPVEDHMEIGSADAIKDRCFNREATSGDVLAFVGVWAKLAVQHPDTAIAAVPWLRDPFVMGPVYDEGWYVRWGWEEMGSNMIMPEYASTWTYAEVSEPQKVGQFVYGLWEKIPGVSLLLKENLYTVWVPLFVIALCCCLRRARNLVYGVPWLLTICSLMLLPGHQTRYTWTLAFGVALIAAIPLIRDSAAGAVDCDENRSIKKLTEDNAQDATRR